MGSLNAKLACYRYLFRLIDVQNKGELQDEEIVPILMCAGLDDATARETCSRLLGGQLTVRAAAPPPALAALLLTGYASVCGVHFR